MRVLITGGAGFIGSNTVLRLLERGDEVVVYDNLVRKGTRRNLEWLREKGKFEYVQADVRDYDSLLEVVDSDRFDAVIHLASQVAVTTSVVNPREDFEINALGTFNVLEAVRESRSDPVVIFASTNKVYGGMEGIHITEQNGKYLYRDYPGGISESCLLDFHSPYGCSKGCGDQYVRDYARIYGLRTVVFRQSCIYGPRQFGIEDQGWLAWFTIAALSGKPITIYGDGKQVRDVLWVEDLIDAYLAAIEKADEVKGRIYNVGGGPDNALAIWAECGKYLEELMGRKVPISYADWRPGDQLCCVLDITRAREELNWSPKMGCREGIKALWSWVSENVDVINEELEHPN